MPGWYSFCGLEPHSKQSPKAITDTNDLRFEYNRTASSKTVSLPYQYIDVKKNVYNGSITLAPYTSAVLIKNGAVSGNQAPTANAGSDQTITLPTSSVNLSGSGSDPDGSISSYAWTKVSGPSAGTITSAGTAATTVTAMAQGVYKFQLKVTDNGGSTDLDTVQITVNAAGGGTLLPAVNPANTVNGLNYSYYEAPVYLLLPIFANLPPIKTGTGSNFDLSPHNRANEFSFNFTGYVNVPADGQYTFYTNSDNGSNLYIDNVLVVNNDGNHPVVEKSGTIGLKAGKHAISVGYFQAYGGTSLLVSYSGPGVSKQAIPSSALYRVSTTGNLVGFSNASPTISAENPVGLKAFPNPFSNSVVVNLTGDAGEYKLQLVDALGKVVWTKTSTKTAGDYEQTINTSNLERGIYFLRIIQNNSDKATIKLIKIK